jgi:hypothetical protein
MNAKLVGPARKEAHFTHVPPRAPTCLHRLRKETRHSERGGVRRGRGEGDDCSYISLSGEMKLVAKAAIDRFDRAVRRHDPGDAAVELATALEGMLGGDGNGELTWKVNFRSALVAGGSIGTRTRVRAIVHSLYDLRSKVVHTGITPTKKIAVKGGVAMSADALVNEGLSVVSLILGGGLKMETKPDWFRMELG